MIQDTSLTFLIPSGGATAVKLLRPPTRSVKASLFALQSRGATAVKLAAPSKRNPKVSNLLESTWRRDRR
jgi:hypothetical protein